MKIMLNGQLLADISEKAINQDQVKEMLINYGFMTHNMPLPITLDISNHVQALNEMVYTFAHNLMNFM